MAAVDKAVIFLATARELEKTGDSRRAIACYEQAVALNPEAADGIAHHLAVLYDKADEPAKSLIEFERALKKNPKDANLLNDLGYHWYNRGDWMKAELNFRKALAIDSKLARRK